ncbi:MinD/ParA family ATP-binding protein [Nocardia tengchongensis]|uniref:MinD/ParA family ATP-binding protein n=1 Tax=Nocardia tengchongensis TaxID=2055889 RepID=UPI0036B2AE53
MSTSPDPEAVVPQPLDGSGDAADAAGTRADYSAEQPVNLREQKLRPITTDAGTPQMRLRSGSRPPTGASQIRDTYKVGVDNLTAPGLSAAERETLREEQLRRLLSTAPGVETDPASWGWRGKANAVGGRFKPRRDEVDFRMAIESIRQPLPGTPVIAVVGPKGGVGRTPTTLMLSALFGRHRGHGVVAWDNSETRGTLAARAATAPKALRTTWDVLAHAEALCSATVVASALGRFLIAQPTGDEVLASDQSSKRREMIGAEECAAILAVLRRHRTMIIVDTPANDRSAAFVWSIEHATQLVIPLTYRRDAAHMLLRTLDGLAARGHTALVRDAVVVLAEGTGDPAARQAVHAALARAEITRITSVPYDHDLASGERIVLSRLSEPTVRAWTRVAAVVADGIAEALTSTDAPLQTPWVPQSRTTPTEYDVRSQPRPPLRAAQARPRAPRLDQGDADDYRRRGSQAAG